MAILFIFDPIANILIAILVVVGSFAVLLPIQPVSFIFLAVGICVNAEPIFSIFVPLPVVDGSAFVMVDSPSVFFAVEELALILFGSAIDVESFGVEFILLPIAHVHILIWEGVYALSTSAILVLPNVLSPIRVCHFLVFWA